MSDKNYHDEHIAALDARTKAMTPKQLDRINKFNAILKKHIQDHEPYRLDYLDKMNKVILKHNEGV